MNYSSGNGEIATDAINSCLSEGDMDKARDFLDDILATDLNEPDRKSILDNVASFAVEIHQYCFAAHRYFRRWWGRG